MLHTRYTFKKIRAAGGRTKGPRARTAAEDAAFGQTLQDLLESLK